MARIQLYGKYKVCNPWQSKYGVFSIQVVVFSIQVVLKVISCKHQGKFKKKKTWGLLFMTELKFNLFLLALALHSMGFLFLF